MSEVGYSPSKKPLRMQPAIRNGKDGKGLDQEETRSSEYITTLEEENIEYELPTKPTLNNDLTHVNENMNEMNISNPVSSRNFNQTSTGLQFIQSKSVEPDILSSPLAKQVLLPLNYKDLKAQIQK